MLVEITVEESRRTQGNVGSHLPVERVLPHVKLERAGRRNGLGM